MVEWPVREDDLRVKAFDLLRQASEITYARHHLVQSALPTLTWKFRQKMVVKYFFEIF